MAKVLSTDLRERVISAVESGMARRAAAKRFGVAASTAIKWVDRCRRTGAVAVRRGAAIVARTVLRPILAEILALIEEAPDMSLAEIAMHLGWPAPTNDTRAQVRTAPSGKA